MSPETEKIEPSDAVETMTNNNSAVSKLPPAAAANGDTGGAGLIEEVVEEGHIVLEQGQHVVMVTEGEMGQQQIVITDGGAGLIQLDNGQQLLMKSEPEDLSLVTSDPVSQTGQGQQADIDMEAGAQAIQVTPLTNHSLVLLTADQSKTSIESN